MEKILDSIDVTRLTTQAVEFLPRLATSIVILLLFFLLYRLTRPVIRGGLERSGLQETLVRLLVDNLYRYALMIIGLIMAADQLGVNVAAALAGLGVAGIALGFAAQDSVANVIAGIIIFWDKPFVVGDWIIASDEFGQVTDITLRSTRIRTPRNTYVIIPNKTIIDTVLENYSKQGEVRVDVAVGIAYKEDIAKAREVLLEAVGKLPHVLEKPAPDVVVNALGDSSINLKLRAWIDNGDVFQKTFFGLTEAARTALDRAGIEIPFPHLQLFVDDIRERVWADAEKFRARSA